MSKKEEKNKIKIRYNIVTFFVYICGIVLLCQLFNLQIKNGEEYRKTSDTRLSRETVLKSARGNIYDRTGNLIAGTKLGFNLELYKTKIESEDLNKAILNIISVLEKNKDKYSDNFPISINPFEYKITENRVNSFLKENSFRENISAEEAFYLFKEKYEISNPNIEDSRKIMAIRYEISINGYSTTKPITIAIDISKESVAELSEKNDNFAGINISTKAIRTYAKGSLASHVIGYIGKISKEELNTRQDEYDMNDYIGKTGIEYVFEEYLKGKNGIKQIDMTVDGTTSGEYISEEAVSGSNIILTIDANLQNIAENALEANINKIKAGEFGRVYEAKSGAVSVINVNNGEILALASYPDYEPELFIKGISTAKWNEYNSGETQALFNRAVQGSYAPGSTFKMISAVAALESGVINRTEKILDRGIYPYGHKPVCWIWNDYRTTHGYVNVSDAIKHSCNYYFYECARRMGISELDKYATYFGLGHRTGIELVGETAGTLASEESLKKSNPEEVWDLGHTLNAVIGQGDNDFSPIQIAKYIAMLSNGGKPIRPTLIKAIKNADETEKTKEEINNFVNQKLGYTEETDESITIDPENLKAILEGMRSVTSESGGTAYARFQDFDIEVGGKTGSTQANNNYVNAWFVGFAPFDNPEIAVVVMVENGGHGNYTAEVVREIIEEYFGMNTQDVPEELEAESTTEIINM